MEVFCQGDSARGTALPQIVTKDGELDPGVRPMFENVCIPR
jgi:hypothetical protein